MVGPATLLGVLDFERHVYGLSERDVDVLFEGWEDKFGNRQFSSSTLFCLILFVKLCSDT